MSELRHAEPQKSPSQILTMETIVIALQNDKEKATNTIESIGVSSFFSVQLYYSIDRVTVT